MNIQKLFSVPDYQVDLMHTADQADLQLLLEKCVDYTQLVTGSPPKPSAAASLLSDIPQGKSLRDKFVFGISVIPQGLVCVLDAVRDYPTQDDWWLGLLLVDPTHRNQGLGQSIYRSFEEWVGHQGGRRVFLGVLEDNQNAYRFWQRLGFKLVEKRPPALTGDHTHMVLTMYRAIDKASND